MAKCDCGDAEVECKCGCGCACIIGDSIPIQDRCFLICCKCPDSGPKNSVAGIASITLGLDAFVGRFQTRKPLNGSTMVKFYCKDLPLANPRLSLSQDKRRQDSGSCFKAWHPPNVFLPRQD
jgi:hypothetical protein